MAFWFLGLMLFMMWRAFVYFRAGRAIAGIAACFGALLFASFILVDYLRFAGEHASSEGGQVAAAQTVAESAPEPVIADYQAEVDADDGFAPEGAYAPDDGFTPDDEL